MLAALAAAGGDLRVQLPGCITLFEKGWVPPVDLGACHAGLLGGKSPGESRVGEATGPKGGSRAEAAAAELLLQERQRYGIIDGQHRVGAVGLLRRQGNYDGRVLVEVFKLGSESEIAELFTEINKAEPVSMRTEGRGGAKGKAKDRTEPSPRHTPRSCALILPSGAAAVAVMPLRLVFR